MLKVPLDFARVLSMMCGSPIFPLEITVWEAQEKHMAPYITSTSSVTQFSVQKGDTFVFVSDGMRSSLTEEGLPDEDVRDPRWHGCTG